jgi:hypothetical protein
MAVADPAEPFWLGFEAFNQGQSFDECPYPRGSDNGDMWSEGFTLASNLVGGSLNQPKAQANADA